MEEFGAWVWSLAIVAGPIILALGLAYGSFMYWKRRRDRARAHRREGAPAEGHQQER